MASHLRILVSAAVFLALSAASLPALGAGLHVGAAAAINRKALLHDTHDPSYRSPFGAVPAGTAVKLSLRTAHKGASKVILHVTLTNDLGQKPATNLKSQVAMRRVGSTKTYDRWQTTITPDVPGILAYTFEVRKGNAHAWYSSTPLQQGGPGQAYGKTPPVQFTITVYDRNFVAPSWTRDAVIYQIFPDRFFNGDPTNDIPFHSSSPGPAPINGQCPQGSYDYEGRCAYTHADWSERPETSAHNQDFFGGDLQGIQQKLPYLKSLGINTLYLTPIFQSPSNHKYDTSDYKTIDPHFGTLESFHALADAAHADGIRIVLDGVFNHSGADSIYFNKYGHFPSTGAFQSQSSPYYPWYTFFSWPNGYSAWNGVTTLPILAESDPVKDFIYRRPDSVANYWPDQGSDGWRLDSATQKSPGWWREFRTAVKAKHPGAVIIAEAPNGGNLVANDSKWLLGNEYDGVMNYRFREAVTRFFAQGTGSSSGTPYGVTGLYNALISVIEDYPLPAIYSSMNLVDSHDTERILYDLGGDKTELHQVAALQMTWVGAPTVYYGDEAGLTGATDPDDRRTFPWGGEDTSLTDYYRTLIGLRTAHSALRDGTIRPLVLDNDNRVFGFLRKDDRESVPVVINDSLSPQQVTLKVPEIANGTSLQDALGTGTYTVSQGQITVSVGARATAVLVQSGATAR